MYVLGLLFGIRALEQRPISRGPLDPCLFCWASVFMIRELCLEETMAIVAVQTAVQIMTALWIHPSPRLRMLDMKICSKVGLSEPHK